DMGTSTTKSETGLTCYTPYTRYVWAYTVCGYSSATTLTGVTANCPCGQSFTDYRDGKTYNTLQAGPQCWMVQNLDYQTGNSWCYDDNTSNCSFLGRLYDWNTALVACPSGWHLPGDGEWTYMINYWGSWTYCNLISGWTAKSLAANYMWAVSGELCAVGNDLSANNLTGFSGLPAGDRDNNGLFWGIGLSGTWWTSTELDSQNAWYHQLYYSSATPMQTFDNKESGMSVRCLWNP
ncbi:MAG TPA: FISUMP domain-containing protein, partial [Bacteroidales bacterium]|nr:FISUMP domain-containing protein [Bacteroidales bacterium]